VLEEGTQRLFSGYEMPLRPDLQQHGDVHLACAGLSQRGTYQRCLGYGHFTAAAHCSVPARRSDTADVWADQGQTDVLGSFRHLFSFWEKEKSEGSRVDPCHFVLKVKDTRH
jgi:hypothetical protein